MSNILLLYGSNWRRPQGCYYAGWLAVVNLRFCPSSNALQPKQTEQREALHSAPPGCHSHSGERGSCTWRWRLSLVLNWFFILSNRPRHHCKQIQRLWINVLVLSAHRTISIPVRSKLLQAEFWDKTWENLRSQVSSINSNTAAVVPLGGVSVLLSWSLLYYLRAPSIILRCHIMTGAHFQH